MASALVVLRALALLTPLIVAGTACQAATDGRPSNRNLDSGYAPRFTAKDIEGRHVALSDLEGKVVLLNFWATWCKPCRQELPELARLHRAFAESGFSVVAVSVDAQRNEAKVKNVAAELGLPFPVWLDPTNGAMSPFQLTGYPTTFLIGADGSVLWRRNGMIAEGDPELADALAKALGPKS